MSIPKKTVKNYALESIPEGKGRAAPDIPNKTPLDAKNDVTHVGFGTPTLRARVSKAKKSTRSSQKRPTPEEQETEKRLADRREKKRAKREVVKPRHTSKEKDSNIPADSQATAKTKKVSNVPLGLSLMYGFTTTSTGSNRLTIEPPVRTVGVFSKGRVSTGTKSFHPKPCKGTKPLDMYCTNLKKKPSVASNCVDPSSPCGSTPLPPCHSPQKSSKRIAKGRTKKRSASRPSTPAAQQLKTSRTESSASVSPNSPIKAGSIAWDIERESFTFSPTSSTKHSTATIVLDTRLLAWAEPEKLKGPGCLSDANGRTDEAQRRLEHGSTLSLRPSESASQPGCAHELSKTPRVCNKARKERESKYFTAIAREPANHSTVETLPVVCDPSDSDLCVPDLSVSPERFRCNTVPSVPAKNHLHSRKISSSAEVPIYEVRTCEEREQPSNEEHDLPDNYSYALEHDCMADIVSDGDRMVLNPDNSNAYGSDQGCLPYQECLYSPFFREDSCVDIDSEGGSNVHDHDDDNLVLESLNDYRTDYEQILQPGYDENRSLSEIFRVVGPLSEFPLQDGSVLLVDALDCHLFTNTFPPAWLSRGTYYGSAGGQTNLTSVELDVAKSLRNHWLPHKL